MKRLLGLLVALFTIAVAGQPLGAMSSHSIVVDKSDQRLYEYQDGALIGSFHVSTGSGRFYRERGSDRRIHSGRAITPTGNFSIRSKSRGWVRVPLGRLYYPMGVTRGGIMIHGFNSVPNYPASHGCVRVTLSDAKGLFDRTAIGDLVTIQE